MLCGDADTQHLLVLEDARKNPPLTGKLIAAWALAQAHDQAGRHAEAESSLDVVREMAPHCKALLSRPFSG